jgi:hypothetical protein
MCAGRISSGGFERTIFFIFFLSFVSIGISDDSKAEYWTRLNYGVTAVKVKQICIADGYITHMFHFSLPHLVTPMKDTDTVNNKPCDAFCSRVYNLLKATSALSYSMKTAINQMVAKVFTLIPDISPLKRLTEVVDTELLLIL